MAKDAVSRLDQGRDIDIDIRNTLPQGHHQLKTCLRHQQSKDWS